MVWLLQAKLSTLLPHHPICHHNLMKGKSLVRSTVLLITAIVKLRRRNTLK
jgi:hypothetical protein